MARDANAWIDREIAGCRFADERLSTLLARMAGAMGGSIPLACQDWAATKAAYRFFSNDRVSEGEILAGHFLSTRDRALDARPGSRRETGLSTRDRALDARPGRRRRRPAHGAPRHDRVLLPEAAARAGRPDLPRQQR